MYQYTTTSAIEGDLARLEELRCQLDSRGVLPRRWIGRMRRDLEAESVAASTSMEGIPVTVEEVRRILAGDVPREVSRGDASLVVGYRDAMAFVLRRADDPDFDWEPEMIREIHDRVLAGDHSKEAGRYRKRQVHLAVEDRLVYTPPAPEAVPALVRELTTWLGANAARVPPAIAASIAHVTIAGIHPFRDGNGRTARIVASLAMFRGGYRLPEFTSLEEWWGGHRHDYYASFGCLDTQWDPNRDVTPFIASHVHAQRVQVETLSLREATEREVWTALGDIATEDLGVKPRTADALFDAFFGRSVTNRYYRGLADVTAATAAADLGRCVAGGMLQTRGAGRSTVYVGTPGLAGAVARAAGLSEPDQETPLDLQRPSLVARLAQRLTDEGCQ